MTGTPEVHGRRILAQTDDAIAEAVEVLLAPLPTMARLTPQTRVLIKPNLLARHAPQKAVTTHPAVLRGVVLALQKRGVKHITVADSPGGPYTPQLMRSTYAGCGITAVCDALGVAAYTACESTTVETNGAQMRQFTLLRPVVESDFIINLPKLKTHVLMTMSGAVKNLFGCIPGLQKAELHTRFAEKDRFAGMLVDLCQAVQADVHLVDGVIGMEGDGPSGGTPRACNLLFAGENPYQVDLALCRVMGMQPMATPVLAEAHRRGLCPRALKAEAMRGDVEAFAPLAGFVPPSSAPQRVDFSGSVPGFLRPAATAVLKRVAPRPVIHKKGCVGCGKCAEICPQKAIEMQSGKARIHYRQCIRCFCCHEICPVHTIGVKSSRLFRL